MGHIFHWSALRHSSVPAPSSAKDVSRPGWWLGTARLGSAGLLGRLELPGRSQVAATGQLPLPGMDTSRDRTPGWPSPGEPFHVMTGKVEVGQFPTILLFGNNARLLFVPVQCGAHGTERETVGQTIRLPAVRTAADRAA